MALPIEQVIRWRDDANFGNLWRYEAGVDEDYYDGNQFDEETAQKMRDRGLPLTVINISRDVVQTMTGLQERSQSDWIIRPDNSEEYRELAEVMALKLHEAERMTGADRACLDAVSGEYKSGIAWVEVGRAESALDYPYRVEIVPWREMWWDPRSRSPDIITDAQYLRRVRFFEKSTVEQMFPGKVAEIVAAGRGSDYTVGWFEPQQFTRDTGIRDMTQVAMDLWGSNRRLVALEEFYYTEWKNGWAVRMPNGKHMRFNPENPMHMQAYQAGVAKPIPTRIKKMNRAVYCGNWPLLDGPSPYPHDKFPFVPFVFDREARTGSPYGMLRVVRPLQDQINTRNARMMWGLNAKRVIYDADAVTDPDTLREEVSRSDAMIEMNPKRNPKSKLEITTDTGLNQQQFDVYQHNLYMAPQLAGVPRSLSGHKEPGLDSGVAIGRVQEMGINSQARPTGMYMESRRRVGELLTALIVEDLGTGEQELSAERKDGTTARVKINEPARHPNGYEYIRNNVQLVSLHTALDDVPQTATFRQQQFAEISRGLEKMPPQVQAVMLPFMVEASEMPNKYTAAKLLRKSLGIPDQDMTPEQQRAAQEQAAKENQQKEVLTQAALKKAIGEALAEMAKADKLRADTELAEAKTHKTDVESAQIVLNTQLERANPPEKRTAVARW